MGYRLILIISIKSVSNLQQFTWQRVRPPVERGQIPLIFLIISLESSPNYQNVVWTTFPWNSFACFVRVTLKFLNRRRWNVVEFKFKLILTSNLFWISFILTQYTLITSSNSDVASFAERKRSAHGLPSSGRKFQKAENCVSRVAL